MQEIPRLVIAGTKTGVGKSSVATGLMRALTDQGWGVQGFKVGPDYLDPGFHALASGIASRNLDEFLLGAAGLQEVFYRQAARAQFAIIEGVMGLFDGSSHVGAASSTASVAKLLDAPVVLVVDCSSMAQTVAAMVKGLVEYDPALRIEGLILNGVAGSRHQEILQAALQPLGVPLVGVLWQNTLPPLPTQGADLVTGGADREAKAGLTALAQEIRQGLDIELLCKLARHAPPLKKPNPVIFTAADRNRYAGTKIGYAYDAAFCFYYRDALDYLEYVGAELIPFSPLRDEALPPGLEGLILGGGFLASYAAELSDNWAMGESILAFGRRGCPLYAEGAGFAYLTQAYQGMEGSPRPMVGLIPGQARAQGKLVALGYYEGQTLLPTALGPAGIGVRGHQYRRLKMEGLPAAHLSLALRKGLQSLPSTGYAHKGIFASHLYQHWAGQPEITHNWLHACELAGEIRGSAKEKRRLRKG